ncbi:unnamed protein product [Haemonchus placei]|uniref:Uncharacterized protein n=1 Tax=Haemonchus placei TaxID=6290 RepID=A0A0N4VS47_HAEPC|nr:unnamed protein product [Haemonchus placei]
MTICISQYGDYRESITTSVNRLESLDTLLNAIDQEYFKRNLNVPSDISEATSLDECGGEAAPTKGPTLHRVFVRNRVRKIRELTTDVTIRYVPTTENPPDIGCRGTSVTELQNLAHWWNGPTFLTEDETTWPRSSDQETSVEILRFKKAKNKLSSHQ